MYSRSKWPSFLFIYALYMTLTTNVYANDSVYKYHLTSAGDQGSVVLSIENSTNSPKSFTFGPQNGSPLQHMLMPFEEIQYLIQCAKRTDVQSAPPLSLTLNQQIIF